MKVEEPDKQLWKETAPNRKMWWMTKYFYYPIVLFGNVVINKIPRYHIRRWWGQMIRAKNGKNSVVYRRVDVLFPKESQLADNVSVGWFVDLDARGGIYVDYDTNISSHTNFITGSYDVDNSMFMASFLPIKTGHHCWIGSRAIILQEVMIGDGAVVTKDIPSFEVCVGGAH